MAAGTSASRILVIEDDPKTADLVALYLRDAGYATTVTADGRAGLEAAQRLHPDLVVLDLMLPLLSGLDVCRALRAESQVPILILSARDRETDRIAGLNLGADDYVPKPFSPKEVVARVRAILRRGARAGGAPPADVLRAGTLALEPAATRVTLHGAPVELTPSEYELLHALMLQPGRTFSRTELLHRLYPSGETVVERVVDVHIGELRAKIEPDRAKPTFIHTVRGFGYRFETPEEAPACAR